MGSSGDGGGGALGSLLQRPGARDQLAAMFADRGSGGALGSGAIGSGVDDGGGKIPMPYQQRQQPTGSISVPGQRQQPTGSISVPGQRQRGGGMPLPYQPGLGGPQQTNLGGVGFDFTDPRYTSRLAEGSGPKASQPDMSAMLNGAANPPAPPPLPGGYPLPKT